MTIFKIAGPLDPAVDSHLFVGRKGELEQVFAHIRNVSAYVAVLA